MRAIGAAERALELMCRRAASRVTFGQPVAERANVQDWIAESRIEIEMARLLTLKAAWLMDTVGNKHARTEIAAIKVAAPNVALRVIDRAIQVHGGGGVDRRLPAGDDVRAPADAAPRRRPRRDPQAHDRPPRAAPGAGRRRSGRGSARAGPRLTADEPHPASACCLSSPARALTSIPRSMSTSGPRITSPSIRPRSTSSE